jgi:hypothetical protein
MPLSYKCKGFVLFSVSLVVVVFLALAIWLPKCVQFEFHVCNFELMQQSIELFEIYSSGSSINNWTPEYVKTFFFRRMPRFRHSKFVTILRVSQSNVCLSFQASNNAAWAMWQDYRDARAVPKYVSLYLFNTTNPDQVAAGAAAPIVVEFGM